MRGVHACKWNCYTGTLVSRVKMEQSRFVLPATLLPDIWQCSETVLVLLASSEWVEIKDDAKCLTMHRTAPYDKNLSDPKCQ